MVFTFLIQQILHLMRIGKSLAILRYFENKLLWGHSEMFSQTNRPFKPRANIWKIWSKLIATSDKSCSFLRILLHCKGNIKCLIANKMFPFLVTIAKEAMLIFAKKVWLEYSKVQRSQKLVLHNLYQWNTK